MVKTNSQSRYISPDAIANAAGKDAANRAMRAAGRTAWNADDYAVAVAEFGRVIESLEKGHLPHE